MLTNMLSSLSAKQLRQAASIREQIDALQLQLDQVLTGTPSSARAETTPMTTNAPAAKKRTMSPLARARIAAAQKRRWAKIKSAKK
jgi:hypothetical protein